MLRWVLVLAGCAKLLGYSDGGVKSKPPIPVYTDGADGLQALFTDVLEAARKDDRERVHDLLATTVMTDDDLRGLFGPRAEKLVPRYPKLMAGLCNRGGVEMVAQVYERKYDTVEVLPVETSGPIVNSTPADRAVGRALQKPMVLYAVRFKKTGESRGMRYDFFFYENGHWRTGNQLGQFLDD